MMCLSKSQDDDIMMMCLSKSQDKQVFTKPCERGRRTKLWLVGRAWGQDSPSFQNLRLVHKAYPTHTKSLEGETTDEMRISKEALFKGVSTQFGPGAIEKGFIRKSGFHHLFLLPKSSFGEHKVEACDCAELDVTSGKFRLDWSNGCGPTCSPFTRMRCHRDR